MHQLAVFDYMLEKEWMMYTYETNFKKSNGNKVKREHTARVDPSTLKLNKTNGNKVGPLTAPLSYFLFLSFLYLASSAKPLRIA